MSKAPYWRSHELPIRTSLRGALVLNVRQFPQGQFIVRLENERIAVRLLGLIVSPQFPQRKTHPPQCHGPYVGLRGKRDREVECHLIGRKRLVEPGEPV